MCHDQCRRPLCLLQHGDGNCKITVTRKKTTRKRTPYCFVCKHQKHFLDALADQVLMKVYIKCLEMCFIFIKCMQINTCVLCWCLFVVGVCCCWCCCCCCCCCLVSWCMHACMHATSSEYLWFVFVFWLVGCTYHWFVFVFSMHAYVGSLWEEDKPSSLTP